VTSAAARCTIHDIDCAGSWSGCGSSCVKVFRVGVSIAGDGAPCEAAHLQTALCAPGEGGCPVGAAADRAVCEPLVVERVVVQVSGPAGIWLASEIID
jgi:hypothetical protein